MGTTASGIWYPDSTDDVEIWSHMKDMADTIEPFVAKPLCQVYMASDETITTSVGEELEWDGTEEYDTHGFHSASNYFRITPTVSGVYRVHAHLVWLGGTAGPARVTLKKNGTLTPPVGATMLGTGSGTTQATKLMSANGSGDYFSVEAYQSTGANRDVYGNSGTFRSMFSVEWVRPL
jgi:hypothetical protein